MPVNLASRNTISDKFTAVRGGLVVIELRRVWPDLMSFKRISCEIPCVQTTRHNIYINSIIIDFKLQTGLPFGIEAARSYRYGRGARHYFLNCVSMVVAICLVTSRSHISIVYIQFIRTFQPSTASLIY